MTKYCTWFWIQRVHSNQTEWNTICTQIYFVIICFVYLNISSELLHILVLFATGCKLNATWLLWMTRACHKTVSKRYIWVRDKFSLTDPEAINDEYDVRIALQKESNNPLRIEWTFFHFYSHIQYILMVVFVLIAKWLSVRLRNNWFPMVLSYIRFCNIDWMESEFKGNGIQSFMCSSGFD